MSDAPYNRSDDGRGYVCARCGEDLPDGVQVLGHYSKGGALTGVRAETPDGEVRHECGAKVADGEGEH